VTPPRDELVQRLLDNELTGRDRQAALRSVLSDPRTAAELAAANQAIAALRAAPRSPDLASRILDEAHRRRPYLPPAQRRWVTTTRAAAAGALLLAFVGLAGAQRAFPHLFDLPSPQPLARVDLAVQQDAGDSAAAVSQQVRRLHASLLPIDGSGFTREAALARQPVALTPVAGRPTVVLLQTTPDGQTTFRDRPALDALLAQPSPIAPIAGPVTGGNRDQALPADAKLP
jgi:hypothetical protein